MMIISSFLMKHDDVPSETTILENQYFSWDQYFHENHDVPQANHHYHDENHKFPLKIVISNTKRAIGAFVGPKGAIGPYRAPKGS